MGVCGWQQTNNSASLSGNDAVAPCLLRGIEGRVEVVYRLLQIVDLRIRTVNREAPRDQCLQRDAHLPELQDVSAVARLIMIFS